MNRTPEQIQHLRDLVVALRSGKYQQTKKVLHDEVGYCCLGVACDISGLGEWGEDNPFVFVPADEEDPTERESLPFSVTNWYGLPGSEGEFEGPFGEGKLITAPNGKECYSLACLNDEGMTFDQIATVIEKEFINDQNA